ncbi:MAG: hypothetical protein DRP02_12010, partial [Candidatus Gerdarchaeota archaeon]
MADKSRRRKGKKSVLAVAIFAFIILSVSFFRALQVNDLAARTITSAETENALVDGNFSATLQEVGQYRNRYGGPVDLVVQDELAFVACNPGELLI